MNFNSTLFSIYRRIKRRRFRKKLDIYKQVYSMSFDKTIFIYVIAFLGYIVTAIVMTGDFSNPSRHWFTIAENIGMMSFLPIISLYPIRYIIQSFRQSGVIFSSSEYQLSILPYGLREIWNVIVLEKWVKRVGVGLILWLILLIIPISPTLTGTYILTLLILDIAMTAPLWRLYQQRFLIKLSILIGSVIVVGMLLYIDPLISSIVVLLSIGAWNMWIWRHLLLQVEWGRVIEGNDHKIWKMPFISSITKVPFKREKRVYVLQRLRFRRKRFVYDASSIHHRLWHSYMIKNIRVLFQMIGILLTFIFAMIFVNTFIFYVSIAISVYIFTEMSASLFRDRFTSDIVEVLPWDLQTFRQTFVRWVIYSGMILVVPIGLYYVLHFTWWAPIQIVFILSVARYTLYNELARASVLLAKHTKGFIVSDVLVVFGLIGIVLSGTYPFIAILTIVYWVLQPKQFNDM